ncbi:type II toxin-antitoxin system Phd/YefM family antitoxin [Thermoflexus hugenholtzii]
MGVIRLGLRQFRDRLGYYLQRVKEGETIILMERGEPIGQILPFSEDPRGCMTQLMRAGLIERNGHLLPSYQPAVRLHGPGTLAELVLEDRE